MSRHCLCNLVNYSLAYSWGAALRAQCATLPQAG
jgi:hypothetical protein